MKYKAIKAFHHDQLGSVAKGAEFTANATQVAPLAQFVERVQAKDEGEAEKPAKKAAKKAD